jgi:hypothetical protein
VRFSRYAAQHIARAYRCAHKHTRALTPARNQNSTYYSVATNNTISHNAAREGVFIEQGAVGITVASNVIGPGNGRGVAIFNNDMNVTSGPHVIAANEIFGNLFSGVAVGSTAPKAGTPDVGVHVMGNRIYGNGPAGKLEGYHTNGAQVGTIYASNDNADGVSAFTRGPAFSAENISIFDPLDREIANRY